MPVLVDLDSVANRRERVLVQPGQLRLGRAGGGRLTGGERPLAQSEQRSQIEPCTRRIDRAPWVERSRRRLLNSVVGDLYAGIHRWL
jgi:hypothetical protein